MARNYVAQKNYRLPIAYGEHPLDSRDKLVKWNTLAVGSDLQVSYQIALGIGPWHEAGLQTYNGATLTDYRFKKGSPGETAADDIYPTDPNHPNAALINFRLPPGISTDNDPDKWVGKFKTREVAIYDGAGNQVDFFYSPNFADVALDGIKLIRPRMLKNIEYNSYLEWRAWCNETIPITRDGATVYLKRFEAHLFFIPPFSLATFLSRLCQLSCSAWQFRKGKLRFMPAQTRAAEFTYDLAQVTMNDFAFAPIPTDSRPNGVRVTWRNVEDQYIREGDPIEIVRRNLLDADGGIENFLEINAGVCRRDQAERIGNYWAKVRCDLTDYAKVVGFPESFKVLPNDIVNLTHDIPNWTNKRCRVIKKEEDEEKKADGIYPVYLQLEPSNPYSDGDFTPLVTRTAASGPNPLTPPPAGALSVVPSTITQSDGVAAKCALLTVQFGNFGFSQTAKVSWKQPGTDEWEVIRPAVPAEKDTNRATFRHTTLAVGTHYFKAEVFSTYRRQTQAAAEVPFVVTPSDLYSRDRNITEGAGRSLTGFNSTGVYVGRDTSVVPADRIVAEVIKGISVNNNLDIDCNVAGYVTGAKVEDEANGYSIFSSRVEVYNKFGGLVKTFQPDGFNGAGTLGKGTFPRKYADPFEEGYFKIIVQNQFGFSAPRYLYFGTTMSSTPPTPKVLANCPREIVATPLSSSKISFSGTFDFSGGKTLKLQKREVGQRFADWVDHESGITSLPYVNNPDFPANKEMEYVLVSSAGTRNASNILRAKTLQLGENAPPRPVPLGLSVVPNPSNPKGSLKVQVSRNTTFNSGIDYEVGGAVTSRGATEEIIYIDNLGEGQSRTVRARNRFPDGVPYSAWTDYATGTTEISPPAVVAPQNFSGVFDNANDEADFTFNPGTGAGGYTLFMSSDGGQSWSLVKDDIPAGATSFSYPLAQGAEAYSRKFLLRRHDVDANSGIVDVYVPVQETSGNQPPYWGFIDYNTLRRRFTFNWTPQGGSGDFIIEISEDYGASFYYFTSALANRTSVTISHSPDTYDKNYMFRISRTDVPGYSESDWVYVPGTQNGGTI